MSRNPQSLPLECLELRGRAKILGVDAQREVMVPKGEMQIALACPAAGVGGGEHGSWVMVDR